MRKNQILAILILTLGLMVLLTCSAGAALLGTAFSYQGRLVDGDAAAHGLYDFQFKLYDTSVGGGQVGNTITFDELDVIDGYFTVELDFGVGVFNGDPRWLEIGVRPGELNDPHVYTILEPRQEVMPTPYALYAENAGNVGAGGDNDWTVSGNDMYAIPSGNVGIGTASPSSRLHVTGASSSPTILGYNSGTGAGIRGENATSGYGVYGKSSSGFAGYFEGQGYFSNNVGIGMDSPAYKLDVAGAANLNNGYEVALRVNGNAAIQFENGLATGFTWGNSTQSNLFEGNVTILNNFSVHGNVSVYGNAAKTGGGSWDSLSDVRLKEINGDYEHGLSKISKLNPVRYSYKEDNDLELPTDDEYIGLVAQEVQDLIPEAVKENTDGYLMVNNDPIIWTMVNAIKELEGQNQELREQNQKILQRLDALETKMEQFQFAVAAEVQQ